MFLGGMTITILVTLPVFPAALAQATPEQDQALIKTAAKGDIEAVKKLIAEGADLHARTSKGMTAYKFAREEGHTEVVRLLRLAGAKD